VAEQQKGAEDGLSVWRILTSVVAAWFGVQKNERRIEDFSKGKPHQFIIAGLIAVVLFVLLIVGVVQLVMHFATG